MNPPDCYKRLPQVLAAYGSTIRILHTLTPLGVAMAGANELDPYKDKTSYPHTEEPGQTPRLLPKHATEALPTRPSSHYHRVTPGHPTPPPLSVSPRRLSPGPELARGPMWRLQLAVLTLAAIGAASPRAQSLPDGTLVKQEACSTRKQGYDDFVKASTAGYLLEAQAAQKAGVIMPAAEAFRKSLLDRDTYAQRTAHQGFECSKITYLSDGLKVTGYLFKPVAPAGRKLPLIIFDRGGHGDLSKVVPDRVFLTDYEFLAQGFVLLAPQYRGTDGGEGKDEFGGNDLDDVLNLIPLARSLEYVDPKNIFMYGFSRGGMMTYLALKNQAPVNAAAVSAGPPDLVATAQYRPEMVKVYEQLIPGYSADPAGTTRERSAIDWPEKINTPLLLLQGTADWRVPPDQQLQLAIKLQQLRKTYAVEVYANDTHGLPFHNEEFHRRIIEWFRTYMK